MVDRRFFEALLLVADPSLSNHLDSLTDAQVVQEVESVYRYAVAQMGQKQVDRADSSECRCGRCNAVIGQGQRFDANAYQPSCPYCVRKHLSAASAWVAEANRYPERAFEAEGELGLAAREAGRSWPQVADSIEEARIRLSNEDILPRQEHFYDWLDRIGMLKRELVFEDDTGDYHSCNYEPGPLSGGDESDPLLVHQILGFEGP